MKQLNLFFLGAGILFFSLLNCSKKNATGGSPNIGNNAGAVNILPSPSVINDSITIRGKNFTKIVSIEFEDETGNISKITKITQTGNTTLQFSLKDATPAIGMGEYKIHIYDGNNALATSVDKYFVLDEETFKVAPQITGISPEELYNIGGTEAMQINGKNFGKTNTLVLVTNKATNTIIQEIKSTDITVDERGASIIIKPEIFYKHGDLLQDVKRSGQTYTITVKVGENPTFLPEVNIGMENTTYPSIKAIEYTTEGTNYGAKITLDGKVWAKDSIFYKNPLTGAEVLMPSANFTATSNTFFMPKDLLATNDYYIIVKQGVPLTAINPNTGGSNFSLTPYISEIKSSFSATTDEYPATFDDNNKLSLTIEGAYLTKPDGTAVALAFATKGNGKEIKNPAITAGKIEYPHFNQDVAEAGDINIVCENVEGNKTHLFTPYTPVISNVSPMLISKDAINPVVTIEGLGFAPKNMVALVKTGITDTPWIESPASTDGKSISFNVGSMAPGTYERLVVKVNNEKTDSIFTPPFTIQAGTPVVTEIETIEIIPNVAVKLLIKGGNFTNNTKIVFFQKIGNTTTLFIDSAYNNNNNGIRYRNQRFINSNTIELTLKVVRESNPTGLPKEAPLLHFNFDTSSDINNPKYLYKDDELKKFGCFKNVVLGWAGPLGSQTTAISQSYFRNIANYPSLYLQFLGDQLTVFGPTQDKLNVYDVNNAPISLRSLGNRPLTNGSNVSSNNFVQLPVNNGTIPAVGWARVEYLDSITLADYKVTMWFYISP